MMLPQYQLFPSSGEASISVYKQLLLPYFGFYYAIYKGWLFGGVGRSYIIRRAHRPCYLQKIRIELWVQYYLTAKAKFTRGNNMTFRKNKSN